MLNVIVAFMHVYIFHAYCAYHTDVTNIENYIITSSDSGLRLDLGVHGVWQPQAEVLFDFKVIVCESKR